jgi:DNA polymerase-3 subunit delta'
MTFEHIPGQQEAARRLRAALRNGRVPHAYLFVGSAGTGRSAAARELARVLLCRDRAEPDAACNACRSCRAIDAGRHPDYHETGVPQGRQLLPIETVREVQHTASLKSSLGGGHIFVVRDAERLSLDAANCFLKTLEEPPAGSSLILIASSLRDLPETVVSRCWTVRFPNMDPDELRRQLEADGLPADEAWWLARQSWGSPGVANALREAQMAEVNRELVGRLGELSLEHNFDLSDWLNKIADAGGGSATDVRMRLQDLLECVAAYYRDLALQAAVGERQAELVNRASAGEVRKDAAGAAAEESLWRAELVLETIERIGANANRRLALDHLFTALAER